MESNTSDAINDDIDTQVIKTEPKSVRKSEPKLSSREQLARLGLRENETDPVWCLCCIFCLEVCLSSTPPSAPISAHTSANSKHKKSGAHFGDIGDNDYDNDANDGNDMDWGVVFVGNLVGDHRADSGVNDTHYDGDDGADGGAGDGGGGGGDGGGGD